MIGSIYSKHPEILLHSLSQMNDGYSGATARSKRGLFVFIERLYIRIFGIPEIGFQVRSMHFQNALRRMFRKEAPKHILDVGSGIGSYVFELSRMFPSSHVDGWEIDRQKLAFTQKFSKEIQAENVTFIYGDITNKPSIVSRYDVIINIDVLEHITDYKKAIAHMHLLLKPGGYLYIHTPQIDQKRFFGFFDSWEHEDHVREGFNPDVFSKDLKKLGFDKVELSHSFGWFGSLAWELNHLFLSKSFVVAGLLYPLLFLISRLDGQTKNKRGLCISVIARKKNRI